MPRAGPGTNDTLALTGQWFHSNDLGGNASFESQEKDNRLQRGGVPGQGSGQSTETSILAQLCGPGQDPHLPSLQFPSGGNKG